ncbi:MAG: formylglycine-generating enzyme family protein [Pseudomonadota bacterium]
MGERFIGLFLLAVPAVALTACDPKVDAGPEDSEATEDTGEGVCGVLDMALVYVPPGTFDMGSPSDEAGREEDEQLHRVTLTHGFCITQHEVTQDSFEEYAGFNPSMNAECGGFCPVEEVSWHTAAWFATRVSAARGLESCYDCTSGADGFDCLTRGNPYECDGFRLPTEAEWEYAARAGETSAFPNGANLVAGDENDCDGDLVLDNGARLDNVGWYCGNSEGVVHPVAQLVHNGLLLYDMSGNVSEWVHDWYFESYRGDAVDPYGPSNGSWRILRGGAYDGPPCEQRVAGRGPVSPTHANGYHGIRLVRSWERR